jgi:hypothetical protein
VDGLVQDLSRSGLFLLAPRVISQGSEAELDLDLPGEPPLRFSAQVVRVEPEGMALRLVGGDENRRSLANFIMRQHATSR